MASRVLTTVQAPSAPHFAGKARAATGRKSLSTVSPLVFSLLLALPACTKKPGNPSAWPGPRSSPFTQLAPAYWERLEFQASPRNGTAPWSVTLVTSTSQSTANEVPLWSIEKINGASVQDRFAAQDWLDQLMRSTPTFTIEALAPAGELSTFGLDRPELQVRIVPRAQSNAVTLKLGGRQSVSGPSFVQLVRDSSPEDGNQVWLARGALLELLRFADRAEKLRHLKLLRWNPESVQKLTLKTGREVRLSLERKGGSWSSTPKRPAHELNAILDTLHHLRAQSWIEGSQAHTSGCEYSAEFSFTDAVSAQPAFLCFKPVNGELTASVTHPVFKREGQLVVPVESLRLWTGL